MLYWFFRSNFMKIINKYSFPENKTILIGIGDDNQIYLLKKSVITEEDMVITNMEEDLTKNRWEQVSK